MSQQSRIFSFVLIAITAMGFLLSSAQSSQAMLAEAAAGLRDAARRAASYAQVPRRAMHRRGPGVRSRSGTIKDRVADSQRREARLNSQQRQQRATALAKVASRPPPSPPAVLKRPASTAAAIQPMTVPAQDVETLLAALQAARARNAAKAKPAVAARRPQEVTVPVSASYTRLPNIDNTTGVLYENTRRGVHSRVVFIDDGTPVTGAVREATQAHIKKHNLNASVH